MMRKFSEKQLTIDQFLSPVEIKQAVALYQTHAGTGRFAKTLAAEVIEPNIERINKALKQENDPLYLAYAVEFVIVSASKMAGAK